MSSNDSYAVIKASLVREDIDNKEHIFKLENGTEKRIPSQCLFEYRDGDEVVKVSKQFALDEGLV